MAEQLPTNDDAAIQWTQATTEQGKAYEFGTADTGLPTENKSTTTSLTADSEASRPIVAVDWPVGDRSWKETSQAVKAIGISRYRLFKREKPSHIAPFDYILQFTNTKGWVFRFIDEEQDGYYEVTTIANSDHFLTYNSPRPTIIAVA